MVQRSWIVDKDRKALVMARLLTTKWLDCYAGRRISSHLFVRYQQRFRLMDFFSTFVRKLNFNNFIGLTVGLEEQ